MKNLKNLVFVIFVSTLGLMTAPLFVDTYPIQDEVQKEEKQGFNVETFLNHTKATVNQYTNGDKATNQALSLFLANLEGAYDTKLLSKEDLTKICNALILSAIKTKDSKDPVVCLHQMLSVSNSLMNIGGCYDASIIIAALLKDTVDDKDMGLDEIRAKFGPKIETIIAELEKGAELSREAAQLQLAEEFVALNYPSKELSKEETKAFYLGIQDKADHLPKDLNPALKKAIDEKVKKYFDKT